MNLLADENIDQPIVDELRKEGHDVVYVLEMAPGISDDEVIALTQDEQRLLLTSDKDFGEMIFRQKKVCAGVILLRLAGLSPKFKARIITALIRERADEFFGNFAVVAPGRVRIRKTSK
ncbi:MAG: DUF5615 family PIN-like protein [Calditrichota bacterium]